MRLRVDRESLAKEYAQRGEGALALRFPLAYGRWTEQQQATFDVLQDSAKALEGWATSTPQGEPPARPGTMDVQDSLHRALHEVNGWQVEAPGAPKSIPVPRALGFNGEALGQFHPDAWHEASGTIIEVEGAVAVENGSVLGKLADLGDLGHVRHFMLVVPWMYFQHTTGKVYGRVFRDVVQPSYSQLALRGFETYMVIGVGGTAPAQGPRSPES